MKDMAKRVFYIGGLILLIVLAGGISFYLIAKKPPYTSVPVSLPEEIARPEVTVTEPIRNSFKMISYDFSKPFEYYEDVNQFYGTLKIQGYVSIEKTPCGWEENCFVNRAWFIMSDINDNFSKFFTSPVGMGGNENAFVRKDAISLGCYDEVENQIKAITDIYLTPTSGRKIYEYTITNEQLKKLLSSDKDHPVILEAIKYFSDGRGAPDCYSFLTDYKIY